MESPNSSKIIKKFNQQLVFSHEEITQIVLQVSPTKFSRSKLAQIISENGKFILWGHFGLDTKSSQILIWKRKLQVSLTH